MKSKYISLIFPDNWLPNCEDFTVHKMKSPRLKIERHKLALKSQMII